MIVPPITPRGSGQTLECATKATFQLHAWTIALEGPGFSPTKVLRKRKVGYEKVSSFIHGSSRFCHHAGRSSCESGNGAGQGERSESGAGSESRKGDAAKKGAGGQRKGDGVRGHVPAG